MLFKHFECSQSDSDGCPPRAMFPISRVHSIHPGKLKLENLHIIAGLSVPAGSAALHAECANAVRQLFVMFVAINFPVSTFCPAASSWMRKLKQVKFNLSPTFCVYTSEFAYSHTCKWTLFHHISTNKLWLPWGCLPLPQTLRSERNPFEIRGVLLWMWKFWFVSEFG